MYPTLAPHRYINYFLILVYVLLFTIIFCSGASAATYNLSAGFYPPCVGGSGWSVSGTTYICGGNGRVTLANDDVITSGSAATIYANNGFALSSNTIVGTASANIALVSNYGTITSSGTNTINGAVNAGSGVVTLNNTTINGALTSSGNINLTGGSVSGLVTSSSNTITTNGTNLSGGATAQSGMTITGGTIAGSFTMTAYNAATFSGVTMTSGSISGASTVTIQNGSVLGSASSAINVSSNSGSITVNNSTVYGNLTAPSYSTVNVTNGASVVGTCTPGSTPANACGGATTTVCPAGMSSGITGNYFNNTTLAEPSTASRIDAPINFSWGSAAPGPAGIGADNFSVRWSGSVRAAQSGVYRFQTVSDDGVRLYVNGNLVISRWNAHSSTTDVSDDVALVAGQIYSIVLEYYEGGGDAEIRLQWRLPGASSFVAIPGGPSPTMGAGLYECVPVAKPPVNSCATTLTAGITGNYFSNRTLTSPVTAYRLDGPINFDWGTGVPGPTGISDNNFSVRWDGYIRVTQTGVHRFQTTSDDGVRLTVNGDLLIDQWNDHSATIHTTAAIYLESGKTYPILMEYYENAGFAVAQLRWQLPSSSTFVEIPRGSSPVSSAGLYECAATPGSYLISHNANGVTCAAEAVTITARNTAGVVYSPPNGTVVTLSTTPATGVWVGGNSYTFTGAESSFTKYLQQTTPATLVIGVSSATASASSSITFLDTVLKVAYTAAADTIPTQIAAVNGKAMLRVISTNPKTGICEARLGAGSKPVSLGYACVNPTTCVSGQIFSVDGTSIAANNNGTAGNYTTMNVTFDSSGNAPITINYSDVGQVRLHGKLTIPASTSGIDPPVTVSNSSNDFVVKPYTLVVTNVVQAASPFAVNAGTTSTGNGFIPAGEKFNVTMQSRNALGVRTPNFGNEVTSSERKKLQLTMGCPERISMHDATVSAGCPASKPDYPAAAVVGSLKVGEDLNGDGITDDPVSASAGGILPVVWDDVGSFRLFASLSGAGYLGTGSVDKLTPSGIIGRFYPNRFVLSNTDLIRTCSIDLTVFPSTQFHFMGKTFNAEDTVNETKGLSFLLTAVNNAGVAVQNYDSDLRKDGNTTTDDAYATASVSLHAFTATENLSTRLVNNSGVPLSVGAWVNGIMNINQPEAQFGRASTPDGPYLNVKVGVGVTDCTDKRLLSAANLTLDTKASCSAPDNNAFELARFDARYGRLRLDDAFGPESANLPVNFITEYWTGNFFSKNVNDSCTRVLRSAITYQPTGNILTPANLTIGLTDGAKNGSTTGYYNSISATEVSFRNGDAAHYFSAPTAGVTGSFNVRVDLDSYPWLRFDWNQDGNYSDQFMPPVRIGFGSYRGHDRVIYWRERF